MVVDVFVVGLDETLGPSVDQLDFGIFHLRLAVLCATEFPFTTLGAVFVAWRIYQLKRQTCLLQFFAGGHDDGKNYKNRRTAGVFSIGDNAAEVGELLIGFT